MWYIVSKKRRSYISIYFPDGLEGGRKKRDVTLSFVFKDDLYRHCRKLGSTEIKRIIGIESYNELVEVAKREHRSIGNYIKHRLMLYFSNE